MIFTRETMPGTMRRGIWVVSRSTPSTRKRTRISRPSGSKWMSEAPSSTAWAMIEFTSLITGASSADSRISVTSASSSSPCSTASATASSRRLMRADQALDVVGRGHHRPHLVAGHQLQVVEREHVRRVGHRDHQVAALVEADRRGVEPAGGLRADQVERAHVGLEDREVDVVEPEALRGRARELVAGDRRRLEQDLLGGAPGGLALLDRLVHPLAREEAHLHDHVGDEARARLALRRGQAVAGPSSAGEAGGSAAGAADQPVRRAAPARLPARSSRVRDCLGESRGVDVALDQAGVAACDR